MTVAEVFQEISAADFFYRNRDIAGFTSPSRSIYSTIRELVENSLDACETIGVPPDIYVRISHEAGPQDGPGTYAIRVEDNGIGIPADIIPSAFGQVLYGSKYKLRQPRGKIEDRRGHTQNRHSAQQANSHQEQAAHEQATLARNYDRVPNRSRLLPSQSPDSRVHETDWNHRALRQHYLRRPQRTTLQVRQRNHKGPERTHREPTAPVWSRRRDRS